MHAVTASCTELLFFRIKPSTVYLQHIHGATKGGAGISQCGAKAGCKHTLLHVRDGASKVIDCKVGVASNARLRVQRLRQRRVNTRAAAFAAPRAASTTWRWCQVGLVHCCQEGYIRHLLCLAPTAAWVRGVGCSQQQAGSPCVPKASARSEAPGYRWASWKSSAGRPCCHGTRQCRTECRLQHKMPARVAIMQQ